MSTTTTSARLERDPRGPATRTRSRIRLLATHFFLELASPTRRSAPFIGLRSRSPLGSFDERWFSEETWEEFVERDENGEATRPYTDTEEIPGFGLDGEGLGEPLFDEEVHSHQTVRAGGYVSIIANGAEEWEEKREKREKRKRRERAKRLGIGKRKRGKKDGDGGRRRGPDGRFVKSTGEE